MYVLEVLIQLTSDRNGSNSKSRHNLCLGCYVRVVEVQSNAKAIIMKKSISTLPVLASAIALALITYSAQADTIQIGTGLDSSGNLLSTGSDELNYTAAYQGSGETAIAQVEAGTWAANVTTPPRGQWITPIDPSTGDPSQQVGLFTYTRTIDGAGSITGEFASDNGGELLVNGQVIVSTPGWASITTTGDYQLFTSFSAVLNDPVNTITFEVYNPTWPSFNPTGLIVAGTATVPDGGMTAMLLGLGVTGLAIFRRKLGC